MKHLIIASLLLAPLLKADGCSQPASAASASSTQAIPQRTVPDSTSVEGEWYLQPALPSDTATGRIPRLHFSLTDKRFSGHTGCNSMSGVFTIQADQLMFGKNMLTTKMACPGYNENDFIANLLRVNRYKIKDGMLWLLIDETPVSKWRRGTQVL